MRLILSSADFSNPMSAQKIRENLPVPQNECRVLFIPNEKATPQKIRSDKYPKRLSEYGFSIDNVIVFDHECPSKYRNLDIDMIYVSGGNTFALLEIIRRSGFDEVLSDYIQRGVTYIGGSAGAHIITQSVYHLVPFDGNPGDHYDFRGIGLFQGILFCHYSEERRRYYEEAIREQKFPVYKLTDEDILVYER